jgi:hypothetical protein
MASVRESPAAVPALAAVVLLVVWSASQAGYPLTHWAPGALIVTALLAMALLAMPLRLGEMPASVKLALGCLLAYTALSFLSILWAGASGEAWEGANRTLLYLMVFALFACWRANGTSATLLVGGWTCGLIGLAVYVALHVDTTTGASFRAMFAGERLSYPVGYPNATAAQWLMAFWPALLLARGVRVPWALRGLLAAGAVVLVDVALLSQSRGSVYATAVMLVFVFVLLSDRLRSFAVGVPVVLGVGLTAPLLLRVGDRIDEGHSPYAAVHHAVAAMFVAALLVGVVVALGAAVESKGSLSSSAQRRTRRGVGALALATLLVAIVGGLAVAGNPVTRVRHGWDSFKGGYSGSSSAGNRLLSGLGSNRYDFYRVALDEFAAHPIGGIGADNFAQQYLAHGRSEETPRYPHSVELRTLTQTGVVGGLLAVIGLGSALFAVSRALLRSRSEQLTLTVAAAALSGFAYWAIHGSFDWFFEFAGLGASAFALLGVACSLAPRAAVAGAAPAVSNALRRRALIAVGAVAALAVVYSQAAPWLSQREIQSAARIWPKAPFAAYDRLDEAARLNPLSDRAYLVAGSIALRFEDLARAEHDFELALQRAPDDAYATLELGAIASESGDEARARQLLERAGRLNPRDSLTNQALRVVRSGKRVDVQVLNRSILLKAEHLS